MEKAIRAALRLSTGNREVGGSGDVTVRRVEPEAPQAIAAMGT
jgi:hypothetical protein